MRLPEPWVHSQASRPDNSPSPTSRSDAVGGLGSNLGALVGGLALGVLSAVASYFLGGEYQQTISVGLLMVVLLVKPAGLFGSQQVRPV